MAPTQCTPIGSGNRSVGHHFDTAVVIAPLLRSPTFEDESVDTQPTLVRIFSGEEYAVK